MFATREEWLQEATAYLAEELFEPNGYEVPAVRVSVGFPSTGRNSKRIGECWSKEASADKVAQIFLHPTMSKGARVLDVLTHELIHATLGAGEGHGKAFRRCALSVGLAGKMTATEATKELSAYLTELEERLGEYPHASLNADASGRKKQKGRMLKAECAPCGYIVRASAQTLSKGAPICPLCMVQMSSEIDTEEDETEDED